MNNIPIPSRGMIPPPGIVDYIQPPALGIQPKMKDGASFADVLSQAMLPPDVEVHFSTHAKQRIERRGIDLDQEDIIRLDTAMDQAEQKGAQNTLVMLDGNAFIVNIHNRTVITAMDSKGADQNVFTHIDSAVMI